MVDGLREAGDLARVFFFQVSEETDLGRDLQDRACRNWLSEAPGVERGIVSLRFCYYGESMGMPCDYSELNKDTIRVSEQVAVYLLEQGVAEQDMKFPSELRSGKNHRLLIDHGAPTLASLCA